MSKKKIIGLSTIGGIILLVIIFLMSCLTKIDTGYVGVIYDMNGGLEKTTLSQGVHFVSPLKHVTQYTVATEQAYLSKDSKEGSSDDESFNLPTSDGKLVNVDLEFSYHYENIPFVFNKFKGQSGQIIEQTFIRGKIKAWCQEVSCKFDVLSVYGSGRPSLNRKAFEHVKKNFKQFGIIIDTLNFPRIDPDEATKQAIQDRVNAKQKNEQAKIEQQTARTTAETSRIQAQGEADSKFIKSQGEAKANKELQKSITPEYIEYIKWSKWNGVLPSTMTGEGSQLLLSTTK